MQELYINKAVELAHEIGPHNLTREALAERLNIAPGSFAHVMGVSYGAFVGEVAERLPLDLMREPSTRMLPALRKRQILAHAVELSREFMYWGFSAQQVAEAAGISKANLARLYTMSDLREQVVRWAIAANDEELLAQARTVRDKLLG